MTTKLTWTGTPDDQTCRINDYVLRVEQMDRYYWWWCVYFQDEQIATDGKQTKEQAKQAAEAAYREHLNKK